MACARPEVREDKALGEVWYPTSEFIVPVQIYFFPGATYFGTVVIHNPRIGIPI